ncbi:hypothetical protein GRF29_103g1527453 [Pseudopithomyces chartarum]|uniref:Uncharacterized protein n=1 Tax=Pseudopithomyces chartarum TaxID=1892770 RepID=A0AAN6LUM9_9PLEO|nr:hypothetical protein GRF29_103g1527453 [Pseudopithomyces chartarum]
MDNFSTNVDNTTTTNNSANDPIPSSAFQESHPITRVSEHRSPASKIVDAIKKPFHKEKKEVSPALKKNIEMMEERKEQRIMEMQKEGLDTGMLEGSKMGRLRQTLR